MATQTLTPAQPKQERVNPRDMIGGFIGEIMENVTGIPQSFEAREPITTSVEKGTTTIGGKTEIQFNNPAEIELRHTRIFFKDLAEAQEHAQKVAHTPSLNDEDLEVQIEAMPEEVWNGKLHLSLDFAKKHTRGKPYYKTEYRRVQKEDVHKVEVATDQQTEAEIQAPVAFEMGENEMFKGTESKSHFTQVAG